MDGPPRIIKSFLTVTSHYISLESKIKSSVLQIRPFNGSHKNGHLSEALTEAVAECKLERGNHSIPVSKDNTINMVITGKKKLKIAAFVQFFHNSCPQ